MDDMTKACVAAAAPPVRDRDALCNRFDAVVMLTWSNWKTEPRSNRYHYARRFAQTLPVYFVQPDSPDAAAHFEATELPQLTLLHVPGPDSTVPLEDQIATLSLALDQAGVRRPLLWIYNSSMAPFIRASHAELKVYHATEDYLRDPPYQTPDFQRSLRQTLDQADLLVAVSERLRDTYVEHGGFSGPTLVATNGCDYEFLAAEPALEPAEGAVFYQGAINTRLDFDLLYAVALGLPGWKFRYCGAVWFPDHAFADEQKWKRLLSLPNVRYLGNLSPEQVRRHMHQATVGIIPFQNLEIIVERSFPLKAFEYVACGLPVVSTPVKSLATWPSLFRIAAEPEEYAHAIEEVAPTRRDPVLLAERQRQARAKSYDAHFALVCAELAATPRRLDPAARYNVLVLFDEDRVDAALEAFAESLRRHSRHHFFFLPALGVCRGALLGFDAVVVLGDRSIDESRAFPGLKLCLTRQDVTCGPAGLAHRCRQLDAELSISCGPGQRLRPLLQLLRLFDPDGEAGRSARTGIAPLAMPIGRETRLRLEAAREQERRQVRRARLAAKLPRWVRSGLDGAIACGRALRSRARDCKRGVMRGIRLLKWRLRS
jgi:glycosyltransferase involved in cell wall biosynthesis